MTKTNTIIETDVYTIDVYVHCGRSIVKLLADVYYTDNNGDIEKVFEYYPQGKKYAFSGDDTINDFIDWFLFDLVVTAAETLNISFDKCKINKHLI